MYRLSNMEHRLSAMAKFITKAATAIIFNCHTMKTSRFMMKACVTRNIIVNSQNECIGLLVDRIGDVEKAKWERVDPPPANIGGVQGKYFEGVFKTENSLIGIINIEELFKEKDDQA